MKSNNVLTEPIDVYLAYGTELISGWTYVNLEYLGEVKALMFAMESSDTHPQWGINTPTYFALDRLEIYLQ